MSTAKAFGSAALAVLLGFLCATMLFPGRALATTASFYDVHGGMTTHFDAVSASGHDNDREPALCIIHDDGSVEEAYCVQYDRDFSETAVSGSDIVGAGFASQEAVTEVCMMMRFVDEGRWKSPDGGYVTAGDERYAAKQTLLWVIFHDHGVDGNESWGISSSMTESGRAIVGSGDNWSEFYSWYTSERQWYAGHATYYGAGGGQATATAFWLEEYGEAALAKKSANPSITDGNACYSLEGAAYSVRDSSGAEVATLTTDAYGNAQAVRLPVGEYLVVETVASAGYMPDPDEHAVEVKRGETATVESAEPPLDDPKAVRIGKFDESTTQALRQGGGTLAGAEFTFRYYDGYYGSASELPPTPKRTWVMRTNDAGIASPFHGDGQKASGDAFYRNSSGNVAVPLGTITAIETKAPDGYLLGTPKLFIMQNVVDSSRDFGTRVVPINYSGDELAIEYNTPLAVETPVRGDLYVNKVDLDRHAMIHSPVAGYEYDLPGSSDVPEGNATLAGAVFEVVNDNDSAVLSPVDGKMKARGEVVCTIVTDADGYASTNRADLNGWSRPGGWHGALAYGRYVVREVGVPEGYLINSAWRGTAFVAEDGGLHGAAGR